MDIPKSIDVEIKITYRNDRNAPYKETSVYEFKNVMVEISAERDSNPIYTMGKPCVQEIHGSGSKTFTFKITTNHEPSISGIIDVCLMCGVYVPFGDKGPRYCPEPLDDDWIHVKIEKRVVKNQSYKQYYWVEEIYEDGNKNT